MGVLEIMNTETRITDLGHKIVENEEKNIYDIHYIKSFTLEDNRNKAFELINQLNDEKINKDYEMINEELIKLTPGAKELYLNELKKMIEWINNNYTYYSNKLEQYQENLFKIRINLLDELMNIYTISFFNMCLEDKEDKETITSLLNNNDKVTNDYYNKDYENYKEYKQATEYILKSIRVQNKLNQEHYDDWELITEYQDNLKMIREYLTEKHWIVYTDYDDDQYKTFFYVGDMLIKEENTYNKRGERINENNILNNIRYALINGSTIEELKQLKP